jgi:hypothetical protein
VSTHPFAPAERHTNHSTSLQFALAAVVALLILSLWLHFFLALEIEGIGREIDAKTEELERLQRANLATMGQITQLESQRRMAGEATTLGFRPQQPLYLAVSRPLAGQAGEAGASAFLSIWSLAAAREGTLAVAEEERLEQPAEPATSVANLP